MKIVECPRDAMQRVKTFITTAKKIAYINQLLRVGFDTIDFGGFVSPIAVPQMKDTPEVIEGIDTSETSTKLLALVANERGAKDAVEYDRIDYLGFPISVSEEFQYRNTHKSIADAYKSIDQCLELTSIYHKELVVYISMAFGNPFNEMYHIDKVAEMIAHLHQKGVKTISLSDTIGIASSPQIENIFRVFVPQYKDIEFGLHLHSDPDKVAEKTQTAYEAGCRRIDGTIKGYGGYAMPSGEFKGNIATEEILRVLNDTGEVSHINREAFDKAMEMAANEVFGG